MTSLEDRLAGVLGADQVLTDRSIVASYESDWTGRFHGNARCVVRPADVAAVRAVLAECAAAGVAVCPQGGNTGLVGGGIPGPSSLVLSTSKMTDLVIDPLSAQATVGAGVPLATLARAARERGLDFGVDLAARDSATVGGMFATNAGGERVLRYGTMRDQVLGVEAVLADGGVISRLAGLPKDNTGYDLSGLLCGSEGTLGVVTKLRVRLVPLLPARTVALIAVADTAAAVSLLSALRDRLPTLQAAEFCFAAGVELVCEKSGLPAPFAQRHPVFVLAECAGRADPTEELLGVLGEREEVLDATLASDQSGRHALWAYRESHTEAINAAGVPVKLDVAVPMGRLAEAVQAVPQAIARVAPEARTILFGHLGEANLHVNVLNCVEAAEQVSDAVLRLVADYEGSISAEHGIGRAKRRWLSLTRTASEVAAMRALKDALDPAGLLNPGVLLPDD